MVSSTLEGQCLKLFALTIFFLILSLVVVTLKCFTRLSIRGFGLDDSLMVVGTFFGACTYLTVLLGCKAGIGQHDYDLTDADHANVKRAILSFQVLYCTTLVFVKSSICVALVRLTTSKRLLFILYTILAISASYGFISVVTILAQCRPLAATWDPTAGKCASISTIVGISYFVTACSIATDLACTILPYVILWNLQMKARLKFTVSALLSLGFLASIATFVRIKYIRAFYATEEFAYKISFAVLWTVVEIGIGIIVGSIPSLKPLVRSISFFGSHSAPSRPTNDMLDDYHSFALRSVGGNAINKTHISAKGAREQVVEESDSMKEILREEGDGILVSSEVRIEGRPGTSQRGLHF